MTQFQTTMTATAPPRKTAQPLSVRLMKSITALRTRCAAFFAPFDEVKDAELIKDYDLRAW